MATEREKQSIGRAHRRALRVLAKAPRGRDVNALLSSGHSFETLADLVRNGLATVQLVSANKRGKQVEVARMRITDKGREALSAD
jgi:hypothetical protein